MFRNMCESLASVCVPPKKLGLFYQMIDSSDTVGRSMPVPSEHYRGRLAESLRGNNGLDNCLDNSNSRELHYIPSVFPSQW